MSKAAILAPSRASAIAVALPWPWAAPVTNATFPANSPGMSAPSRLAAIGVQVLVQLHLERIVEHVGRHHDRAERGECGHLRRVEVRGHPGVCRGGDAERRHGEAAAELHDGGFAIV